MTTEQMDALDDERATRRDPRRHLPSGLISRPSGQIKVERRATATYQGNPIPRAVLQEFLDAIPGASDVEIHQVMGGHQLDQHVTGYRLVATW